MQYRRNTLPLTIWLLFVAACSQATVQPSPVLEDVQPPEFPPTWTHTAGPTQEVIATKPPPEEFFTPTPTATSTATPSPDVTRAPTATLDLLRSNCFYSTQVLGIELFQTPYFKDSHILPTMEPGYAYQAVEDFPTMTHLFREGVSAGWVDYRMLDLDAEGSDCGRLPRYEGDLTDFDDYLCFLVADPPVETYMDAEFTEPAGMMISREPHYVITSKSNAFYGSCVGHAGPCFYINPAGVDLVGRCDDLPRSAETITDTELWSDPSPTDGSVIQTIPAGKVVLVQPESATGAPPPGAPSAGTWLRVKLTGPRPIPNGWVWSSYIQYR